MEKACICSSMNICKITPLPTPNLTQSSNCNLIGKQRCKICLGIARGLVYLHKHRLQTVQRDIKAANILLDGNLEAKISDFGLASLYTEDNQFEFIKVEVPQGYIAPEYVRGIVTFKADVYSFGVVLHETAYHLHGKGRLLDLIDRNLSGSYDAKEAIIILNLAVKCTSTAPAVRPTMSDVVSVLVGDKRIDEICPSAPNDNPIAQVDSSAL
ncbi:putative protein kinase RLK-Pelle-DLSV family [Rosa chinensis]|uniref:Protein kinase domain-containing protein n=1 Tax=Rosa chinensis TaxID=74649 RepID=A0A2P6SCZ0_ROSCH|nr:cold-responsive protein kinase 1-like [Rosa chinensis]PRQ56541.1 putative protein kinase RLK-Pelle-DLSV family [Rosa chinensis]